MNEPFRDLLLFNSQVPVDLRLHSYLSALAKACPCPCSIGGSRELTITELSADSLEDLHIVARQQGRGWEENKNNKKLPE